MVTNPSIDLNAPPPDGPHYLLAVTDMAERCPVVAHSAIYNDSGIKLVEKGARIDARLYDRLVQHRLQDGIDGHLSAENAVDLHAIAALARQRCQEPLMQRMVQAVGGEARLLAPLESLPLPAPMAFKLTVMREQQPALLAHSVGVMLVSLYLGLQSGLDVPGCASLAAAALLHDIGVLHMDPIWRDPAHKVAGAGRKHLVAHPVTAMLLVRAQPDYPPAVAQAVLEHHERMDGTGYPRGLEGGAYLRHGPGAAAVRGGGRLLLQLCGPSGPAAVAHAPAESSPVSGPAGGTGAAAAGRCQYDGCRPPDHAA